MKPRIRGQQPLPTIKSDAGKLRIEAALKTLKAYAPEILQELVNQAQQDGFPYPTVQGKTVALEMMKALEKLSL